MQKIVIVNTWLYQKVPTVMDAYLNGVQCHILLLQDVLPVALVCMGGK